MKFIYSDSLDYIDPNYDFLRDQYGEGRVKYWDDNFAHEYMDSPPYDGILVSRGVVGDHQSSGRYSDAEAIRFRRDGARKFLRYYKEKYPESLVFGDCGAFQYVKMPLPPYSPEDMISFYIDGGFTHGCSVDHIIFQFDTKMDEFHLFPPVIPEDIKIRYEVTLELASEFIKLASQLKNGFIPIGVVQGWSPLSMAKAADSLIKMGYKYLAIGGLVPLQSADIHKILSAIRDAVHYDIQIHLLGFAKADNLKEFFKYSISSFDTASPMIRAFRDARRNYFLYDNNGSIKYYTAIRIPQAFENNILKKKIRSGQYNQEFVVMKETEALRCIRGYAENKIDLEETIEALKNYSKILIWNETLSEEKNLQALNTLMNHYRLTLKDRPWDKCNCRVCRDCGVEAIIFRSSNRNKRRGMHNLENFYNHLGKLKEQI